MNFRKYYFALSFLCASSVHATTIESAIQRLNIFAIAAASIYFAGSLLVAYIKDKADGYSFNYWLEKHTTACVLVAVLSFGIILKSLFKTT